MDFEAADLNAEMGRWQPSWILRQQAQVNLRTDGPLLTQEAREKWGTVFLEEEV